MTTPQTPQHGRPYDPQQQHGYGWPGQQDGAPYGYPQQFAQVPQQRQPAPAPRKRRKWPFVFGGVVVLAVLLGVIAGLGSGGSGTTAAPAGGGAASAAAAGDSAKGPVAAGQAQVNDGVTLTATALKASTSFGQKVLCTTVSYRNGSTSQAGYNQFDWKLQDPNGAIVVSTLAEGNTLNSGNLAAGGSVSGGVCFKNPGLKGTYQVQYTGSIFSSSADVVWTSQVG
ncbi:hypothetical protein GCM10009836_46230 [Pseudonocardia ailaonensis]|uniref:DUF4352 domain-containing protein n=1 Tax=Pseudonocardia ailaonensis TaxID=367279 RepID=A0ABN2NEQ5_9PSEU